MAIIDDQPAPEKQGPSLIIQIAVLAGMTVAAIGIGWGSGIYLNSTQPQPAAETGEALQKKASETTLAEAAPALGVVYLDPITTNLAGPVDMWVRLEMALVFEGETDAAAALAVQQDTLAYLRTIKPHQVEGASGFQHLKSDLKERAVLRSEGKVTDILLKTLLFE